MKFLFSKNISDGSLYYEVPSGIYKSFVVLFQGTNGAVAATLANLGTLLMNYKKFPLINDVDVAFLSLLNNLKGGVSTFTSVALGTLQAFIEIPCGEFGDTTNSYFVEKEDVLYFRLSWSALAALAGITGTVKIFGIEGEGVQNYLYGLTQRNVVASGAGRVGDVHRLQNISCIYLKNYASVTDVLITKDSKLKMDARATELQTISDFTNQIETSVALIEMDLNPSRTLEENVGNQIDFSYNFTGASTLEQYFSSIILTPEKAVKSVIANSSRLGNKIANGVVTSEPKLLPAGNTKGGTASGGGSASVPIMAGGLMPKLTSPNELSM